MRMFIKPSRMSWQCCLACGMYRRFAPLQLLSVLVNDKSIIRCFIDVIISRSNRKYGEGIQNVMRMLASMNGCPDKTLNDLKLLGLPISMPGQFKARAETQLKIERMCAMLRLLADNPPVVIVGSDNFWRDYKRKTGASHQYGSWGTMNLTNTIALRPYHLVPSAEAVRDRIKVFLASGVGCYDGVWSDAGKGYLLKTLHTACDVEPGSSERMYGGGFLAVIHANRDLDQDVQNFCIKLLDAAACDAGRKALKPAFQRSMMHGTASQDESIEGLLQRIVHIGLMNIDSNSKAGCMEMLRLLCTHPACRLHMEQGCLFVVSGDIAPIYNWLNAFLSKAYPTEILRHIVFFPDMFLHPLIKLNKVIWSAYPGIISRLFAAGQVGRGKFMEHVRLSQSRTWLNLIHEIMERGEGLKEMLYRLKIDHGQDLAVISASMFLEQHLPLAVALSNCMDQAKSDDLVTRQLAFDTHYRVLLPAMAHSFHLLKSHTYR